MDIEETVYDIAERVKELKSVIETEEATKTALIIPFIQTVLGYDTTDPREVIPEYTADIGSKKGEKVDYAIKSGDDFRFLIECKKVGEPLSLEHATQLVRYFNVTDTDFAILTNGEVYQFYTQLDEANRMDKTPFMVLNLAHVNPRIFPHLEMCTKKQFDAPQILQSAERLKYVTEARRVLMQLFKDPDEDWVRHLASRFTSKRMTATNVEFFHDVIATAQAQFLNDEANRRLQSAQTIEEAGKSEEETAEVDDPILDTGIVTTPEELQAFQIIRAIGCTEVPVEDITMRDSKSYCAILYRDNNRKTIVRLHFTDRSMRIGLLAEDKTETLQSINGLEDIYRFSDEIRARLRFLSAE